MYRTYLEQGDVVDIWEAMDSMVALYEALAWEIWTMPTNVGGQCILQFVGRLALWLCIVPCRKLTQLSPKIDFYTFSSPQSKEGTSSVPYFPNLSGIKNPPIICRIQALA